LTPIGIIRRVSESRWADQKSQWRARRMEREEERGRVNDTRKRIVTALRRF
jgi:hypothetical protein